MSSQSQLTLDARSHSFEVLCEEVQGCRLCARMDNSARVLGPASGNLGAALMFVGEAPGRLGADDTGIPFHGDAAGDNFEDLLQFSGLDRNEVFVTNAVLCNPKDEQGRNARPSRSEVLNCSAHLRSQIDLVQPEIVVSLGEVALLALGAVERHDLRLAESVRSATAWYGRLLVPLYHPSRRALLHRSFSNQRSDYQYVADLLRERRGRREGGSGKIRDHLVLGIVTALLSRVPVVPYFALHKLFFLVEVEHVRRYGRRATNSYVVRQKDGPYCVDLHPRRLERSGLPIRLLKKGGTLHVARVADLAPAVAQAEALPRELVEAVEATLRRYGGADTSRLKTAAYMSLPMRRLLRKERSEGRNLVNQPIDFLA